MYFRIFKIEIINCDSIQVYKDLKILSNRPNKIEEKIVPHHLYGYIQNKVFSVQKWLEDVQIILPQIRARGNIPVFVGGTGLYVQSLIEGISEIPVTQKKYKDDKKLLKIGIERLNNETGLHFWPSLELSIRHTEAMYSNSPVLAKLWFFWSNHFAIVDGGFRTAFYTGPYEREIIRPNLNQSFEKLVYDVTISSAMIDSLDNSQNIGPKSKHGKKNKKSSCIK